jgi:hypothetical protein
MSGPIVLERSDNDRSTVVMLTHCDIPPFRLGQSVLDPRVEHRNAGLCHSSHSD